MAVPDSSPRASVVVSVRIPQRLMLADGTFFPHGCYAVPAGCASAPAGVAPEAFQEHGCSCKVFSAVPAGVRGVSFSRRRQCFSRPRPCTCTWHTLAFGASLEGVAVRRAPEPGPSHGDRGMLSVLFRRPFAIPPRDRGVRHSQLSSFGSRIADSLSCYYRVIQVDAHAPFDKGWLVVRRLVHESAYAGVLGRARSRSLGTEGAEALPRWDPSTSRPRWLLNTTCWRPRAGGLEDRLECARPGRP
jgi:hypothetical protein